MFIVPFPRPLDRGYTKRAILKPSENKRKQNVVNLSKNIQNRYYSVDYTFVPEQRQGTQQFAVMHQYNNSGILGKCVQVLL